MKRIYLIFALLLSLLLINVVNAKEQFRLEFGTEDYNGYEHVAYKDGYIFVDRNQEGDTSINYYSQEGDVIKSKEYIGAYHPIVDGNSIFIIYYKDFVSTMARLNENLEIEKEAPAPDVGGVIPVTISDYCEYICNMLTIKDNTVYYLEENGDIYSYDKNLVEKEHHQITEDEIMALFPELELRSRIQGMDSSTVRYHAVDKKGDNIVVAKTEIADKCQKKNESVVINYNEDCFVSKIALLNKQLNKIWEKELPAKTSVDEVRFVNNYIIAVANEYELDNSSDIPFLITKENNNILVYDMEGNMIQTIEPDESFKFVVPSKYGFAVMDSSCSYHIPFESVLGAISEFNPEFDNVQPKSGPLRSGACTYNHKVYSVLLNIDTKVTQGKGTIKVASSSKAGEPVTFVVTPEEGYILGEVKVTDRNGNVIVFKKNTFTMPTSDVLVEATFLVKNAETKDIAITLVALLAVITGGLALYQYRRIKNY